MSWDKAPKGPFWNQRNASNGIDELLNHLQQRFQGKNPREWLIYGAILIVGLIWILSTSVFIVDPQESAIVQRLGVINRVLGPGPQLKWPSPIETYHKEKVKSIRRLEVGFRTIDSGPPARYQAVKKESLMLTGDENILDVQFTVQYYIKDISDYFINLTNPEETVRNASESAIRETIGHTTVDDALTTGKGILEIKTKDVLQAMLDRYSSGIHVENVKLQDIHPPDQVKDAFKDVTNAKEDKEKMVREAEGYANNLIPNARGEAEQILNNARGYAKQVVLSAEGKALRFNALYREYTLAKEVTRERIRIETMEQVLTQVHKIVADPGMGNKVLPFLPLPSLDYRDKSTPAKATTEAN